MAETEKQVWNFNDPEKVALVKENICYRHPGNRTKWLDGFTVELEGKVDHSTVLVIRQHGGKRID